MLVGGFCRQRLASVSSFRFFRFRSYFLRPYRSYGLVRIGSWSQFASDARIDGRDAVNRNLGAENKQKCTIAKTKRFFVARGGGGCLRLLDSRTDLVENFPNCFFHVKRSYRDDNKRTNKHQQPSRWPQQWYDLPR